MTTSARTHHDLLAAFSSHGRAVVDLVARLDPGSTVPACPDWDVAELAWHLGWIWQRFGLAAAGAWGVREDFLGYAMPPHPAPDDSAAWLSAVLDETLPQLRDADPATVVWNWTAVDHDLGWVVRRIAHETVVHHLDLAGLAGEAVRVDPVLAADGVDELFPVFAARGGGGPLDGPVALVATDVGRAWTHAVHEAALVRVDDSPVATVTGDAEQLLRWVWRRPADVQVSGDAAVAKQLQDYCFRD